jgi:ribonucleoside-diphosphate reductase alpha chain
MTQQLHKETLDYVNGDKFRAWALQDRYLIGKEQWIHADLDAYIPTFKFVPGGRILRGLGCPEKGLTLFNCLALPNPEDSLVGIGSIMDTANSLAEALKRGAGVGFDLTNLRALGEPVKKSAGKSSGPVSFMGIYSEIVNTIQQGGTRRGALLMSLHESHPDIIKFINVKNNISNINYANISVRMDSDPLNTKILDKIAESAWATGEPGIIFVDTMKQGFAPQYISDEYVFSGVNACSEIPLPAWGVCCLGAINLSEFVSIDGVFDLVGFQKATVFGVNFLNCVIDTNRYPFIQSRLVQQRVRQIGLGIMGVAHALFKKGLEYGSDDCLSWLDSIMELMRTTAVNTSVELCNQNKQDSIWKRGIEYKDLWKEHWQARGIEGDGYKKLVNSSLLSGQPTGTTSIIADTSNGIEPVFALNYQRKIPDATVRVKDPVYSLIKNDHQPNVFKVAHQIHWKKRIDVQAIFQKYIDNAISSTVNLSYHTTANEVKDVFRVSRKLGLKSITVFRDGCSRAGVLQVSGCKSGTCDM